MIDEFDLWLRNLSQPEYLHVLLNPLPIYGTAVGVATLVIALAIRNRPAQLVSLVVITLSCASIWLVARYGHMGYDRVYSMSYADAQAWLDLHQVRADRFAFLFYVTAAVALFAIVIPLKFPQAQISLILLTMFLALVALLVGGWIAHAGGQVRHSEFREAPPKKTTEQHDHEHAY